MNVKAILLGFAVAISTVGPCAAEVSTSPAGKPVDKDAGLDAAQLEMRGDIFRSQNDLVEARRYYERALKKNQKSAKLWNKLGVMSLQSRDYDAAQMYLLQAVKYDKKFAEAVNNLGVLYYIRKDYNRAEMQYKRALELADTASFHSNLGALYLERDETSLAIEQYRLALQLDPQVLERTSATGVAARAVTAQERGRYAFLMARLYARLGDVDHSLDHLKRSLQNGYKPPVDLMTDADFTGVRQDPRFPDVMNTPAEVEASQ